MMPTPGGRGGGQHLVERLHPERVEDDLDARDVRAGDGAERLVGGLDADAVRRDDLLVDEAVEHVVRRVVVDDLARRAVQLHEVDGVDAEVAARAVEPRAEVGLDVVRRHLLLAAAHLGRDGEAGVGVVGDEAADDLLAAAVAVDVGGVVERHARLGRRLEHRAGVVLADVTPVGAELPGAEADDRGGEGGAGEAA